MLRRNNACFLIKIFDQDLKSLPKERREELTRDIPPEELLAPAPQQIEPLPEEVNNQRKKKKKRSALSSQRNSSQHTELNWIQNMEMNRDLKPDVPEAFEEDWEFKLTSSLKSTDDLYERFAHGYYHSLQALEEAFAYLIQVALTRCQNQLARNYLNWVHAQCLQYLSGKKELDFRTKWLSFYDQRFDQNCKLNPCV